MLKFLTHKLRTHSLNEDTLVEKVEERDSGTESDDEADHTDSGDFCSDVIMKWNDVTDITMSGLQPECACPSPPAEGPLAAPPAPRDDLLYDHHSSEEELEVINATECLSPPRVPRRRGASSPPGGAVPPGKRKWPQQHQNVQRPESDDDDTKVETPVRFRTSPPRSAEAVRPRRGAAGGCSPPCPRPCPCPSPRRAAPSPTPHVYPHQAPRRHRPALDFDKMQQLKVVTGAGVRSWRGGGGGGAGGELSVFCW